MSAVDVANVDIGKLGGVPIVVIHQGYSEYLRMALVQAAKWNPYQPLILLGNDANKHLIEIIPNLIHQNITLSPQANQFQNIYEHQSHLDASFELFCLQRWFILAETMRQQQWNRCLALDSDVLLFSDIAESGKRFDKSAMSLARWEGGIGAMGHTNFINDADFLQEFCDFLLMLYTVPEGKKLRANYSWFSDMSALHLFWEQHPERIGDICEITNGAIFDSLITDTGCYQSVSRLIRKRMKNIRFKNGVPVCRHKKLMKDIRFESIHFQGKSKYLMKYYFQGKLRYHAMMIERLMRQTFRSV